MGPKGGGLVILLNGGLRGIYICICICLYVCMYVCMMPRSKKGQNREESSQRSVYRYLERMTTCSTGESQESANIGLTEMTDKDLRSFLASEFGKTNANSKRLDSRLLLTEEKLDRIEQINKQL